MNDPRRKLLVATTTLRGGTGAHLVRLVESLDPARWQVQVLCYGRRDFDPPGHVPLIDESGRGRLDRFPIAQWRQLRKLQKIVSGFRPDVVHAFFFWPIIYARILKRLGVIRHLVENREDQGFAWSDMDYRLLRASAGVPDRIICVSEAVQEVLLDRERPPKSRTVIVRNGVSLPRALPSPVERERIRAEFGFSPEHQIVGMVANLDHEVKGAEYFVESVPMIAKEAPQARFLVLGEGRRKEALRARAEALGVVEKVVFAGFRSDMVRLYPIMDVSVLTSLSEGLSITVLESMSFGLPMVATRVGGNPELIEDGKSGFLVPPRDPAAFAQAVIRVLSDRALQRDLGREGRTIVERSFSLPVVAARYDEIYSALLEEGDDDGHGLASEKARSG